MGDNSITVVVDGETVHREPRSIEIVYHPDENTIQMLQFADFGGDLQSIMFPPSAAAAVIGAIQKLVTRG